MLLMLLMMGVLSKNHAFSVGGSSLRDCLDKCRYILLLRDTKLPPLSSYKIMINQELYHYLVLAECGKIDLE